MSPIIGSPLVFLPVTPIDDDTLVGDRLGEAVVGELNDFDECSATRYSSTVTRSLIQNSTKFAEHKKQCSTAFGGCSSFFKPLTPFAQAERDPTSLKQTSHDLCSVLTPGSRLVTGRRLTSFFIRSSGGCGKSSTELVADYGPTRRQFHGSRGCGRRLPGHRVWVCEGCLYDQDRCQQHEDQDGRSSCKRCRASLLRDFEWHRGHGGLVLRAGLVGRPHDLC